MRHAEPPSARLGAILLASGAAPFVAGAAIQDAGAPRLCPFSLATGLPCPLCGSTRSFSLAAEGDPAFLEFNAVWVAAASAVFLAGLAVLALAAAGRRRTPALPRGWLWPAVAVLVTVAWAWALLQRDVIVA